MRIQKLTLALLDISKITDEQIKQSQNSLRCNGEFAKANRLSRSHEILSHVIRLRHGSVVSSAIRLAAGDTIYNSESQARGTYLIEQLDEALSSRTKPEFIHFWNRFSKASLIMRAKPNKLSYKDLGVIEFYICVKVKATAALCRGMALGVFDSTLPVRLPWE